MMNFLRRFWRRTSEPLGRRGERIAAHWLKRQGYCILYRNLTVGDDEADIIALAPDGITNVIVEVKSRTSDLIAPEESLNQTKQYRLSRLATRIVKLEQFRHQPLRFDVIAVIFDGKDKPQIRHVPAAFECRW